jgi:hypothetical protein
LEELEQGIMVYHLAARWERPARGGGGGKGQPPSKGKGMTAGVFDSLCTAGYIE